MKIKIKISRGRRVPRKKDRWWSWSRERENNLRKTCLLTLELVLALIPSSIMEPNPNLLESSSRKMTRLTEEPVADTGIDLIEIVVDHGVKAELVQEEVLPLPLSSKA